MVEFGAQDPINKSALEYNISVAPILRDVCAPLFNNFGLNVFTYSHFFNDGTYVDLCTHAKWHERYIAPYASSDFVRSHVKGVYDKEIKYILWDNAPSPARDKIHSNFIADSCGFDIWHGFSMYRHNKKSVEAWHFATTKENSRVINFYLNNIKILNRFILYFQDKAADIIYPSDAGKLVIMNDREPLYDNVAPIFSGSNVNEFMTQTDIKRHQLQTKNGVIYLSRREKECLLHLAMLRTTKDMANRMNLSSRTIEAYLNNIKKKTNCYTKSQLMEVFIENSISLL